jgi:UDP-N-acetylglucosamine transferase subunit ALG13
VTGTAAGTGIVIGENEPLPIVLVTVGTTYHTFDRLMGWLEGWLADHPGQVRMVIQHGPSRRPAGAEGFAMCGQEELLDLMRRADVVVTQGGPGGIMDSRNCGILPLVVPRIPELNEVVDDHQVRFCTHLAHVGMVRLATDEATLRAELDAAIADPAALRIEADAGHVAAAVQRTGELIEQLVAQRPPRHRRRARR